MGTRDLYKNGWNENTSAIETTISKAERGVVMSEFTGTLIND